MKVPTAYVPGHEKARAVDPEMANKYVAHTVIGDPLADAVVEELSTFGPQEVGRFIKAGMNQRPEDSPLKLPPLLRQVFGEIASPPDWLDLPAFAPGVRLFHRNTKSILAAMVAGVLVEGFSTNISKSFFITGHLRDQGVRRLQQNSRHMVEIFIPQGLERYGDSWKLSVRILLIHAQTRHLLKNSDDWDTAAWGTPLSAAHMGFAITTFSARLLSHMRRLGVRHTQEEGERFLQVWRYSGYLMGIPESILFHDEDDARRLFEIGKMCEPAPDLESIAMANSLINSAPLVAGIVQPDARRGLAQYVYGVSRALIGDSLANELMYPRRLAFGVIPRFRLQSHRQRLLSKLSPKFVRANNFNNFTSVLEASMFDEEGITYRMPDHVYAEETTKW